MTLLYKFIYWNYRATSGLWHWARRRFTRAGLCVAGAVLVSAAVGADIENTVSYQSFALLLALLLFAFACSFFFRAKFSATRILPRVGTAGQPLPYRITVKNLTAKNQAGLTLLENLADPRPSFADWLGFQLAEGRRSRPFRMSGRKNRNPFRLANLKEAEIPPLLPHGEGEARGEISPLRRGVLKFSGVTIARPDPLGLFRSFIKIPAAQNVLILPRRYALPDIAFDTAHGLHSIPVAFGERGAIAIARGLHIVTVSCLVLIGLTALPAAGIATTLFWGGVTVATALLAYEHSLVRPGDLSKLNAAFFTMNGVISLTLLAFVLAGRLLATTSIDVSLPVR